MRPRKKSPACPSYKRESRSRHGASDRTQNAKLLWIAIWNDFECQDQCNCGQRNAQRQQVMRDDITENAKGFLDPGQERAANKRQGNRRNNSSCLDFVIKTRKREHNENRNCSKQDCESK